MLGALLKGNKHEAIEFAHFFGIGALHPGLDFLLYTLQIIFDALEGKQLKHGNVQSLSESAENLKWRATAASFEVANVLIAFASYHPTQLMLLELFR